MTGAHTVADLLRTSSQAHSASPAIVGEGRTVTYGELDTRTNQVASGLLAQGLDRGDRVAYLARNGTEFWELFFGTAKSGAAVVPLNFRLSAPEIAWILSDAEPSVLVVEDHLTGLVPADYTGLRVVFSQEGEPTVPDGWVGYEPWLAQQSATDPRQDVTGDELLSLMYSSGTTGTPKGVTTTGDAMLAAVAAFSAQFEVGPDTVSLVPTPYYHIAAGGWSLISLAHGGQIIQFIEVTPQSMIGLLVAHRATHVIMVPTVMAMVIANPQAAAADYSSVQHLVYGGSPISETVMLGTQKIFDAKLSQSYGLTETIGVLTILRPEDHVVGADSKLQSAGRAVPGVELRVVDGEGKDVPAGEVGEIVTRGANVTRSYWRRPDATEASFFDGGWFRTGDAGYLDEDGYLFLKDRLKDMIVTGGENVYPAEVENVLMAHPAVQEVAVIGIPSERWGETPHAVVVTRQGESVTSEEIIAFCRERLAHYKCPTSVEVIEMLPRNPSGKILKRELRAPHWAAAERTIG
ncbi:long-chain-fatty-acid--CoA ligase [Aeromicrobium duanguangcaii]|uniref:Long-chain-fatty-acid--CoA ligase n=1 Tax=Aeromicrobium duanguangcaii TaxID=2968086 RepID=A0ABY5KHX2_9ACTN|nr:long-chain-fatty-acid--CoA ligase [Aeromicrobium duanguangcaii]MCD9153865.1 long-chain-fatty-acid--CoA ligase [Aeromicrobium duanguangcaii]UUI69056.1 long-chain-fatty-acid--CoA ligase [Aeromicrobium duanguangcaii]